MFFCWFSTMKDVKILNQRLTLNGNMLCKKIVLADCISLVHHTPIASFQVLSHLTVKERCLCASLVCKYWRDLCLDFQFWKQIDLSGLQQVSTWSHVFFVWHSIIFRN